MEEYLQTQVATGEYDLLANLAILKLCVEMTEMERRVVIVLWM